MGGELVLEVLGGLAGIGLAVALVAAVRYAPDWWWAARRRWHAWRSDRTLRATQRARRLLEADLGTLTRGRGR